MNIAWPSVLMFKGRGGEAILKNSEKLSWLCHTFLVRLKTSWMTLVKLMVELKLYKYINFFLSRCTQFNFWLFALAQLISLRFIVALIHEFIQSWKLKNDTSIQVLFSLISFINIQLILYVTCNSSEYPKQREVHHALVIPLFSSFEYIVSFMRVSLGKTPQAPAYYWWNPRKTCTSCCHDMTYTSLRAT